MLQFAILLTLRLRILGGTLPLFSEQDNPASYSSLLTRWETVIHAPLWRYTLSLPTMCIIVPLPGITDGLFSLQSAHLSVLSRLQCALTPLAVPASVRLSNRKHPLGWVTCWQSKRDHFLSSVCPLRGCLPPDQKFPPFPQTRVMHSHIKSNQKKDDYDASGNPFCRNTSRQSFSCLASIISFPGTTLLACKSFLPDDRRCRRSKTFVFAKVRLGGGGC